MLIIWCGSGSWIRFGKKLQVIFSTIYWIFFNKAEFSYCVLFFFAYFYAKTWWIIQKSGNFYNLSFFNSSYLGFEWILDPDPESQNLADPTDPDPKHWKLLLKMFLPLQHGKFTARWHVSLIKLIKL